MPLIVIKKMNPIEHQIKTALISVSDKSGLLEFASALQKLDIIIYSTGGTLKLLQDNNISAKSVSELTQFPEILDGRLKTLHPKIHGGLLADLSKESHLAQMAENGISSLDLVVVNLYPFEVTLAKKAPHHEMIENIDIGGPSMLRAAAKNYKWTAVVANPAQYSDIINELNENNACLSEESRIKLAGEVFNHTAYYDAIIASYFNDYNKINEPKITAIGLKKSQELRYGENPHQAAALYGNFEKYFDKLHGKELSYNNIIDINAAAQIILEFEANEPAVAIIKHTNPCGVGLGKNLSEAYNRAFATDTVSPFGGIIAFNGIVDLETATTVHDIFTEVLIAPDFTPEAFELLTSKKNRRLIRADYSELNRIIKYDFKSVAGGYLVQQSDKLLFNQDEMKIVTKRQPTEEELKAMLFGWKVCKHVKSNSIVYTSHDRTLGIGAGQMSRVDSSRIAVEKAKLMGIDLTGSAVASDAFFPFADGLQQAAEAGATAVIQPGGSVRDDEVIKAADDNNIAMIFTGMRHFRH